MFYYLVNICLFRCYIHSTEKLKRGPRLWGASGFEVRGGIAVAKCRIAAVIATSIFRRRRLSATKVLLFSHIRKFSTDIFEK